MAQIDHNLEYNIRKAKTLISNLPREDKEAVEAYIRNIEEALEDERKRSKEMRAVFDGIARFAYVNPNPTFG